MRREHNQNYSLQRGIWKKKMVRNRPKAPVLSGGRSNARVPTRPGQKASTSAVACCRHGRKWLHLKTGGERRSQLTGRGRRWMFFRAQNKELDVWEALIALLISDIRAAGVSIWMKNIWTPGSAAQGAAATKGALIVGESGPGFSITCPSLITYFKLIIWKINCLILQHLSDML